MIKQGDIKEEITHLAEKMSSCISKGFTVTLRPTKDGVKITSHKEKIVK